MFLVCSTILCQLQRLGVHKRKHSYEIRTPKLLRSAATELLLCLERTDDSKESLSEMLDMWSGFEAGASLIWSMSPGCTVGRCCPSREVTHPRLCVPATFRCTGMVTDWIQPRSKDWLSRIDSESVNACVSSPSFVCLQNASATNGLLVTLCHFILCECHHILCECHHILWWVPLHPVVSHITSFVSPIISCCEFQYTLLSFSTLCCEFQYTLFEFH
jgi:hypothetical protein